MKLLTAILALACLAVLYLPAAALGDEDDKEKIVSGKVSVAGKYESNVDLISENLPDDAEEDEEIEDAWITELSATLLLASTWASPWHLELELFVLADLFPQAFNDSWGIGRGNLTFSCSFGANTISLLDEIRYFTEPDDREFDHFRNSASLVYKRTFSPMWQGRIGYDNIAHVYPESRPFNYFVNGGFIEIRNIWAPAFSTYYYYGFQYYRGIGVTNNQETLGSPEEGVRHTGEVGFEWFFARKNSLIGAYVFQWDRSTNEGVRQIGDLRGEEENLELDAEFNFTRHKGSLLYSHRFNDRFTLSLYGEFNHKFFPEGAITTDENSGKRTDLLWLGSVWFTARLVDELYAKIRYLYRANFSDDDREDFQDHIGYLGLEYRF